MKAIPFKSNPSARGVLVPKKFCGTLTEMARYSYLTILFGIAMVTLVVAFSIFYVRLADVEHLLVIHFESLRGVDFLGSKSEITGVLASGLALVLINFLVAAFLHNRSRLFSYLIGVMTIFISLLILLTISVIISVN